MADPDPEMASLGDDDVLPDDLVFALKILRKAREKSDNETIITNRKSEVGSNVGQPEPEVPNKGLLILKSFCVCILLIGFVYGILAYILVQASQGKFLTISKYDRLLTCLDAFGSDSGTPDSSAEVHQGNLDVCGADSFMLRDGVCDEATNNERCHYDGGDCCLDRSVKNSALCKVQI